jgi:hypothetical protein
MTITVPIERLREALSYDAQTGAVTWKEDRKNGKPVGSIAGSLNPTGYRHIRIDGRMCQEHRIAWALHYGQWPDGNIDHINGVPSDNRIENLRCVLQATNNRNARRRRDNTSGVTGVLWYEARRKWGVKINRDGKAIFLGLFANVEDAIAARRKAEAKLGYHENHGRAA